jgi:hypothetical protein
MEKKFTKLSYFGLFWLGICATVQAQSSPFDAEMLRFKAQTNRDTLALKTLLADNLYYAHSNGLLENKQDFIKSINSGKIIYDSITIDKHSIQKQGQSAIITGECKVKGVINDKAFDIRLRYLSVYTKQKGRWKLAAWQSLKL